jgi:hypothetical protein
VSAGLETLSAYRVGRLGHGTVIFSLGVAPNPDCKRSVENFVR